LAWLLSKPVVASVLVGASKLSQLQQNLQAVSLSLSAEELDQLNRLTEPGAIYPNWFNRDINDGPVREALAPKD
jgi:aryl-alcohol dehydrogenase-like predicted oxidoreductase